MGTTGGKTDGKPVVRGELSGVTGFQGVAGPKGVWKKRKGKRSADSRGFTDTLWGKKRGTAGGKEGKKRKNYGVVGGDGEMKGQKNGEHKNQSQKAKGDGET